MGDIMFKIGDLVTRNSYNNDIVFKVVGVEDDNYLLQGVNVRLCADSYSEDLKKYKNEVNDDDEKFFLDFEKYVTLDRDEYFYLPGKILHIDADDFLYNKA